MDINMSREGYIKLHRQSMEHCLFTKPLVWHLWNYCLLEANHQDNLTDFNGRPFLVKRSQFITSFRKMATNSGLSVQNVRTAVRTLENHGMIKKSTQELTQDATLITICNYGRFQGSDRNANTPSNKPLAQQQHTFNKPLAQQQHTFNKPLTTNKNEKNEKNEKNILIDDSKFEIHQKIIDHLNKTCGKRIKLESGKNKTFISDRLAEGYTLEDFKKVIDNKNQSWYPGLMFTHPETGKKTPARNYLKPSTLFINKNFNDYLNENSDQASQQPTPEELEIERKRESFYKKMEEIT
jgi:uncharacterized phage protein (TIGR02220 family)